MLEISLNLSPDVCSKRNKFSKALLKDKIKFIQSGRNGTIAFNLSFILLLAEFNLILKKESYKKDVFIACGPSHIKIVFVTFFL